MTGVLTKEEKKSGHRDMHKGNCVKMHREKMVIYKPRREAWNRPLEALGRN